MDIEETIRLINDNLKMYNVSDYTYSEVRMQHDDGNFILTMG